MEQSRGSVITSAHMGNERDIAIHARSREGAGVAHESVPAKCRFHSVEIDPDAANLDLPILAADSFQQPVRPFAYKVSGPENTAKSQRHVRARDNQLSDFARQCAASVLVDHGEPVSRERIADGNARVVTAA